MYACVLMCVRVTRCVSLFTNYFLSPIHTHTHTHHTYTHIQVAQSAVVNPPQNAPVHPELDDDSEGVSESVAVCSRVLQSVAECCSVSQRVAVFLVSRTQ